MSLTLSRVWSIHPCCKSADLLYRVSRGDQLGDEGVDSSSSPWRPLDFEGKVVTTSLFSLITPWSTTDGSENRFEHQIKQFLFRFPAFSGKHGYMSDFVLRNILWCNLVYFDPSEDEARESLVYSYTRSFNAFAAKLSVDEAEELSSNQLAH